MKKGDGPLEFNTVRTFLHAQEGSDRIQPTRVTAVTSFNPIRASKWALIVQRPALRVCHLIRVGPHRLEFLHVFH
jgi:hypothetical protein